MAAKRRRTAAKHKVARKGLDSKGRFLKRFYQPCAKGAKIRPT